MDQVLWFYKNDHTCVFIKTRKKHFKLNHESNVYLSYFNILNKINMFLLLLINV